MYPPVDTITTIYNKTVVRLIVDERDNEQFTCNGKTYSQTTYFPILDRLEFWQDDKCGVVINANTQNKPRFDQLFNNDLDSQLKIEHFQQYTRLSASADNETHYTIGIPNQCEQSMTFYRQSLYWMQPETAQEKVKFPDFKQGCAVQYQRTDGLHVIMLANQGFMYGDKEIKAYTTDKLEILIAYGYNLTKVWASLFENVEYYQPDKYWSEFMYCTWNGLGLELSTENILNILQDLHDNNIKVPGLIIDDGWQYATKDRRWIQFEAKPSIGKLKDLVSTIKQKFPYIQDIGVWSAINGYWNGIADGCFQEYKQTQIYIHGDKINIFQDPDKLFDDYFSFLKDSGITCVKIDNQGDLAQSQVPTEVLENHVEAIRKAACKYFGNKIIWCMAMVPQIMSRIRGGVLRNSDDFFPEIASSHYWHVYTNFCCAQMTSNYNCALDFDMFQTKGLGENFSNLHAAARCLSGGPIYFTDKIFTHDIDLLKKITLVDYKTGKNCILKLSSNPTLENPYSNKDKPLRVKSIDGTVLGLFNTTHKQTKQTVIGKGRSFSGHLINGCKTFYLNPGEFEIITKPPFLKIDPLGPGIGFLGNLDHFIGISALDEIELDKNELACKNLKFAGPYGFLFDKKLLTSPYQHLKAFVDNKKEKQECLVEISTTEESREGSYSVILVIVHIELDGDLILKFK